MVRRVFCVVVVFVVSFLFVCLLDFLVFLNRKFPFSNGFFYLYNLHQVPCDKRFCFVFFFLCCGVWVWGGWGGGKWR